MQIGQAFEKCAEESFGHVGQEKIKQDMNMTKKHGSKKIALEREISITMHAEDIIITNQRTLNTF